MNNNRYYDPFEFLNINKLNAESPERQTAGFAYKQSTPSNRIKNVWLYRLDNGKKIAISKSIFTIGKSNSCDYVITDNNAISRNHAEIKFVDDAVYVTDKKSTNKTFVNGNVLNPENPVKVTDGDEIKFANVTYKLKVE